MDTSSNSHEKREHEYAKDTDNIGEIPPSLVRGGILIIIVIILSLFAAVYLLPFPYSSSETILQHILNLLF